MATQRLTVVYDGPGIQIELDQALKGVLAQFGYERWASGYDLVNDKRDLAFHRLVAMEKVIFANPPG